MSTVLIIPAGGLGTRLAPITNTLSKALIRVAGRPAMMHSIVGLRDVIDEVLVVASLGNHQQVTNVLEYALADRVKWRVLIQHHPNGPVNAISLACSSTRCDNVIVMMADTVYAGLEDLKLDFDERVHAAVERAPSDRAWCWWNGESWWDGINDQGASVFTGLLWGPTRVIDAVTWDARVCNKPGMAHLLNVAEAVPVETVGWQDVGDLDSLARAHAALLNTRPHHSFSGVNGVITKRGVSDDERRFYQMMVPRVPQLFPQVYSVHRDHIKMAYVDAPSLTELYLYAPAAPETWSYLMNEVLNRCPWDAGGSINGGAAAQRRWRHMMITKTEERLAATGWQSEAWVDLKIRLMELCEGTEHRQVMLHGDLCFSNVLWSAESGTMKLIDPRGSWGDDTFMGDELYDLAKLRASYHGNLSAITHRLFTVEDDQVVVTPHPEVDAAIDDVLKDHASLRDLCAVEAAILFSSAPLHHACEQHALLLEGERLAKEALCPISDG